MFGEACAERVVPAPLTDYSQDRQEKAYNWKNSQAYVADLREEGKTEWERRRKSSTQS